MDIKKDQADKLLAKGMITEDTHKSIMDRLGDSINKQFEPVKEGDENRYNLDTPRNRLASKLPDIAQPLMWESVADEKNWRDHLPENMAMAGMGSIKNAGEKGLSNVVNMFTQSAVPEAELAGFAKRGANMAKSEGIKPGKPTGNLSEVPPAAEPAGPTTADKIEMLKNRFGDDADMHGLIDSVQGHNDAYVNVGKGPFSTLPNGKPKMTGVIGKPGIAEPFHSSNADQFPWMDQKYGTGKNLLEQHQAAGKPAEIHTSSDLIAHDDYMNAIPQGSKIYLHAPPDSNLSNLLFPGNASRLRVARAAEKLKAAGHDVQLVHPTFESVVDAVQMKNANRSGLEFGGSEKYNGDPIKWIEDVTGADLRTPEGLAHFKEWGKLRPNLEAIKGSGEKLFKGGMISADTHKLITKKFASGGAVTTQPNTSFEPALFTPQNQSQAAPLPGTLDPSLMQAVSAAQANTRAMAGTGAPTQTPQAPMEKSPFDHINDESWNAMTPEQKLLAKDPGLGMRALPSSFNGIVGSVKNKLGELGAEQSAKDAELMKSVGYQSPMSAPAPDQYALHPTQGGQAASGQGQMQDYQANMQKVLGMYDQGFGNMEKGAMMGASAGAKYAAMTNTLIGDVSKNMQQRQAEQDQEVAQQQARKQELADKYDRAVQDFTKNSAIDPNRYWANQSTGSKITAAIAVAFGGLGRGNVQNGAYEVIKDAINRDVDAQKANVQAKAQGLSLQNNVFSQMSSIFQDQRSAFAASQASLLNIAEMRVKGAMASLQGAQAQADGIKLLGQIQQAKAEKLQQVYMYTQAAGGLTSNPAQNKLNLLARTGQISPEEKKELNEMLDKYGQVQQSHSLLDEAINQLHDNRMRSTPTQRQNYQNALTTFASNAKELFGRASEGDIHQMIETAPGYISTQEGRDNLKALMKKKLDTEQSFRRLSDYGLIAPTVPMRDVTNGR